MSYTQTCCYVISLLSNNIMHIIDRGIHRQIVFNGKIIMTSVQPRHVIHFEPSSSHGGFTITCKGGVLEITGPDSCTMVVPGNPLFALYRVNPIKKYLFMCSSVIAMLLSLYFAKR